MCVCDDIRPLNRERLSTYILSTPLRQGLRTAAFGQPHQTIKSSDDHWWQRNNKKKHGCLQGLFHPRAVGQLLHKGPALGLLCLETEVAGPFAFPRGTQADEKLTPKHLNWGWVVVWIHRKMAVASVCSCTLGGPEGKMVGCSCSNRQRLRLHVFPGTAHPQGLDKC